jgi:hypothetical protein
MQAVACQVLGGSSYSPNVKALLTSPLGEREWRRHLRAPTMGEHAPDVGI